jgi:hypothetical protein
LGEVEDVIYDGVEELIVDAGVSYYPHLIIWASL